MKKSIFLLSILLVFLLISCQDKDNEDYDKTVYKVRQITLSYDVIYLNVGTNFDIETTFFPKNTIEKDLYYESKDNNIVSVDEKGTIKGLALGETNIIVKSKANTNITDEVLVRVVEKSWPIEKIVDFFEVELPDFEDYVAVETPKFDRPEAVDNIFILRIRGVSNPKQALLNYKNKLTELGWKIVIYNEHLGKLTHDNYDYFIQMYNDYYNDGHYIDFRIVKNGTYVFPLPEEELD